MNKNKTGEKCPYCGSDVVRCRSEDIYGEGWNFGAMKKCARYPACDAYSGAGATVGDRMLRMMRKRCHRLFDARWKGGGWSRGACYHWLAKVMGMTPRQAHIARFRDDECRRLLRIIDPQNKW